MELKDTVAQMESSDYKERFIAEYMQTKIRYEKLKAFNTKIEAARRTSVASRTVMFTCRPAFMSSTSDSVSMTKQITLRTKETDRIFSSLYRSILQTLCKNKTI